MRTLLIAKRLVHESRVTHAEKAILCSSAAPVAALARFANFSSPRMPLLDTR